MADEGLKATDAAIVEMEKKIHDIYFSAFYQTQKKLKDFKAKHPAKNAAMLAKVQSGELAQEDYEKWLANQQFTGELWAQKKKELLKVYTDANKKAAALMNGQAQNVFATNANWQCYDLEQNMGVNLGFTLYDSQTMAKLLKDEPELLPKKSVNTKKDMAWNDKKITSAIQQGVVQGKPIPEIAKDIAGKLTKDNSTAAYRTARTAMTSAQNAGRLEGMKQAEEMGVQVKKQWLAMIDGRQRKEHEELDGQIVDVDKPFVVDGMEIDYPADPKCPHAEMVYNCRCTMKYIYPKYSKAGAKDYFINESGEKVKVTDATFKEWVEAHNAEIQVQEQPIVQESTFDINTYDANKHDELANYVQQGMAGFGETWDDYTEYYFDDDYAEKIKGILGEYIPDDLNEGWQHYLKGGMDIETTQKIDMVLSDMKDTADHYLIVAKNFTYVEQGNVKLMDKWEAYDVVEQMGTDGQEFLNQLSTIVLEDGSPYMSENEVWDAYLNGSMDKSFSKKIDGFMKGVFPLDAPQTKAEAVDLFAETVKQKAKTIQSSDISQMLYAKGDNKAANDWFQLNSDFWDETGKSTSLGWEYQNNYDNLDAKWKVKYEEFVAKTMTETNDPQAHMDAYKMVQGKGITEFKAELNAVNSKITGDFSKEIKAIADDKGIKPKEAFELYKQDALSVEQTEKLDGILKQYAEKKAAGETHTIKHYQKKPKDVASQATLPNVPDEELHKTFKNIWKDDVTYEDWEDKKDKIQGKKDYFNEQIEKAIQAGDTAAQTKFEGLLNDLNEFEAHGEEYSKILEEQAKNAPTFASNANAFIDDAYSQARRDAALWETDKSVVDSHLRSRTGQVWRNASQAEKEAIYDYTGSYSKFNEPLRGFEYGTNVYKGVGKTDLNAGYKKNGNKLNAMTRLIDKCSYDEDIWMQRGVGFGGMDKFFQCDMHLLEYGSEKELQNALLGKNVTEYGFMSCGTARGQGFAHNPIIMNIYAPSGTKMMYVEPISQFGMEFMGERGGGLNWDGKKGQHSFGHEFETLLQQGTQFRITKVEKSGGKLFFDLEVIAQEKVQLYKK